jgi:hypothetical protein
MSGGLRRKIGMMTHMIMEARAATRRGWGWSRRRGLEVAARRHS